MSELSQVVKEVKTLYHDVHDLLIFLGGNNTRQWLHYMKPPLIKALRGLVMI